MNNQHSGFVAVNIVQANTYATVRHSPPPRPIFTSPLAAGFFWLLVAGVLALAIAEAVRQVKQRGSPSRPANALLKHGNTLQPAKPPPPLLRGMDAVSSWTDRLFMRLFVGAFVVGGASFALYVLAVMAFGKDTVESFMNGVGENARWLMQSAQGNSVVGLTLLALTVIAVVAFVRAMIIKSFGYAAFGWGQVVLGVILACGSGASWYHDQLRWFIALGGVCVGLYLMSSGTDNIRIAHAQQQAPQPQLKPQTLPRQTVHGDARNPTADEIRDALLRQIHGAGGEETFDD